MSVLVKKRRRTFFCIFFGFSLSDIIEINVGKCIFNFTFIIQNFVACDHVGTQIFLYMWTLPYTEFQCPTMLGTGLKVCVVVVWWQPVLVFSCGQAEQYFTNNFTIINRLPDYPYLRQHLQITSYLQTTQISRSAR